VASARRLAFVSGVFYLLTFVLSIPAYFLYAPVLTDQAYVIGPGAADTQVIMGAVLELLTALAGIGTAVAVFPVIKRQSEAIALGFVTTRVFEAAVMIAGVVALLTIVGLREAGVSSGADSGAMIVTGRTLVAARDVTAHIGPGFIPCLNALLFGYVLYRSRLVPRVIPALGLIGAPLLMVSVFARIFGLLDEAALFNAIALIPIFVWELSIGLWMTFKGFDHDALAALGFRDDADASNARPSTASAAGGVA